MQNSLSEILKQTKPRAALLTTYTLSLSYFEAAILPVLKQRGCRDTILLVDEQESLCALNESRSMGAGRAYRFLPVASPGGGFFHPKIVYLECDDDDILVVGSGNLTFSGQGGNLECIDAVSSSEHPGVFEEFSDWCKSAVEALIDTHPQVASHLDAFSRRAASRATKFANVRARTAWLVHTGRQTAFDQIIRIAQETGDWTTLRVLSPFHPPNGSTSIELAKTLRVTSLEMGVNPSTGEVALDQDQFVPHIPVRYVSPHTNDESPRPLHAKWFELFVENRALVITGSVNATHQSMQSKKNVEISLARLMDKSPSEWEVMTPTDFVPSKFEVSVPSVIRMSLEAHQMQNSRIKIQLHKPVQAQTVTVTLQSAGTTIHIWNDVSLLTDGKLITEPFDMLGVAFAVTVIVTGVDFNAIGLLNVEVALSGSDLSFDHLEALGRLAEGKGLPGDNLAFLLLVAQFAKRPPPLLTAATKSTLPENVALENDYKQFSYRQWLNSSRNETSTLGISNDRLLRSLASVFNLNPKVTESDSEVPKLLSRNFEEHESESLVDNSQFEEGNAPTNKDREAEEKKALSELVPKALRDRPDQPYAYLLAQYLLADALVFSKSKVPILSAELALSPCWKWLQLCGELQFTDETRDTLFPLAVAVAGWMGYMYSKAGQIIPSERLSAHLNRLGDGRKIIADNGLNIVIPSLAGPLLNSLSDMEKNSVISIVSVLANAESLDEKLVQLVKQALSGVIPPPNDYVHMLFPGIAAKIREHKNARKRFGILTSTLGNTLSCPCCYARLEDDVIRTLKRNHATICPQYNCKKVLLDIQEKQLVEQLKEYSKYG